ncbi:hypothetical protein FOCC_FOCC016703 [Frankliniella occidentalis]|nr:hypothetical protein FOCC_FOCC016703 [Frankliniella occidentalis]
MTCGANGSRKQGAVISLSSSRERDVVSGDTTVDGESRREPHERARKVRKISSLSVPEGKDAKDALVLLHNGNHGDGNCYLAEDCAEEDDDDEEDVEDGDEDTDRWYSTTVELVRAMMDFSLFLELHFLLMSVGTTLLYTWFVVPYFYLADHLIENGYTQADASHMLGVVGYANTFGMVPLEVLESLSSNKRLFNVVLENYPSLLLCRSTSLNTLNKSPVESVPARVPVTMSMRLKQAKKAVTAAITSPTGASATPPESGVMSPASDPAGVPLLSECEVKPQILKSPVKQPKSILTKPPPSDSLPWLKRQFSVNTPPQHYLKNIRVHRNSVMYRGAMLNIHKYRLRASSCPDIYRNSMTTIARESDEKWYDHILEPFRGMVDFTMFLELHFLMMSLSTILLFTWFIVPYFYLADFMVDLNYKAEDASTLLSIIGVTNTIGMIVLGWAGDQPWMNVTKTYAFCLAMCGAATAAMPLCIGSWPLLVTASALFGVFFASTFSFTPVILVQLIPLDRFTLAYGLILLCQGIGNLIGPPIAGWLFDVTGSWYCSFYMAAGWIAVSGLLCYIIPITKNRRIIGNATLQKDRDLSIKLQPISDLFRLNQFIGSDFSVISVHHRLLERVAVRPDGLLGLVLLYGGPVDRGGRPADGPHLVHQEQDPLQLAGHGGRQGGHQGGR